MTRSACRARAGTRAPPRHCARARRATRAEQALDVGAHVRVVVGNENASVGVRPDRGRHRRRRVGQPAQRFFDERLRRRARSTASARGAATRSAGRCAVPSGIATVNVGALPGMLATCDGSAMERDQFLHQREADAGAFVRPRPSRLRRGGTARRRAASSSAGMPAPVSFTSSRAWSRCPPQPHGDLALEGELERVRQQVEHDLLPHLAIDVDRLAARLRNRR